MKIYKGIGALSDFRRAKLLKQLRAIDSNVQDVQAEYIHFVDGSKPLSDSEDKQLRKLLTYDMPFRGKAAGE